MSHVVTDMHACDGHVIIHVNYMSVYMYIRIRTCISACQHVHEVSPPPPTHTHTEDSCYYDAGVSDLDEYVLNTKGRIWVGSARSNYGRPWQFAQFSKDCLEVALWILEHMNGDQRNDPVEVRSGCGERAEDWGCGPVRYGGGEGYGGGVWSCEVWGCGGEDWGVVL